MYVLKGLTDAQINEKLVDEHVPLARDPLQKGLEALTSHTDPLVILAKLLKFYACAVISSEVQLLRFVEEKISVWLQTQSDRLHIKLGDLLLQIEPRSLYSNRLLNNLKEFKCAQTRQLRAYVAKIFYFVGRSVLLSYSECCCTSDKILLS